MTSDNFELEMTSQETYYSVVRGGSRIFFRRGCTRLLLYFNTNKPHSFFLQNTGWGGGGAHPLHPPSRSTPGKLLQDVIVVSCLNLINLWNVFWFYTSIETITLCCFFKRWVAWEHSFISNVSVGRKTLIYSEIPLPAFALVYLVYFCLFIYLAILS